MGKLEGQQLPVRQCQNDERYRNSGDSGILCWSCSMGFAGIGRMFSLKCIVVLIFSLALFLSAVFWILPLHSRKYGFDAKEAIKRSATVQAYFRLTTPVSVLVPKVARLEYDLYEEIGLPSTKVAILSMHESSASNWTDVVFGVLPDHVDGSINPVSLSLLRSSFIELFLQQFNLTLGASFEKPSSFEILKFPDGITVIPEQAASIWQLHQTLFNFTLNNPVYEIKENLVELKEQLKLGLYLRPNENIYVQITNKKGSTKDPPVTIQASVMTNIGGLVPQRLKQLAQAITGSPATKNLGLDNAVFGKVKEISLSSYLSHTLHSPPPMPSPTPSPAPDQHDFAEPPIAPVPAFSPIYSAAPSPDSHHEQPCFNCDASSPLANGYPYAPTPTNEPHLSFPPISHSPAPHQHCGSKSSPAPSQRSRSHATTPASSPSASTLPKSPTAQLSPSLSPLPAVSYGSSHHWGKESGKGSQPPSSPPCLPPASSAGGGPSSDFWFFHFFELLMLLHFCFS